MVPDAAAVYLQLALDTWPRGFSALRLAWLHVFPSTDPSLQGYRHETFFSSYSIHIVTSEYPRSGHEAMASFVIGQIKL